MPSVRRLFSSIRGHVRLRTILFVLCAGALAVVGAPPAWWAGRGVTNQNEADDYAPINQGQLKNLLKSTALELDEKLPGGAGETLHQMIAGWANPTAQPDDYAAVNVGQLKAVAKAVYDRLITAGYVTAYPWENNGKPQNDYALANIGQAKNVFTIAVAFGSGPPGPGPVTDGDGDLIPNEWELLVNHTDPLVDNSMEDPDGDGMSRALEHLAGRSSSVADSPVDFSPVPLEVYSNFGLRISL